MSEIDNLRAVRARAARFYATSANRLADALETNPAAESYLLMNVCRDAWETLARSDQAVRRAIIAGDPIDDFYRKQDVLDGAAEGTAQ